MHACVPANYRLAILVLAYCSQSEFKHSYGSWSLQTTVTGLNRASLIAAFIISFAFSKSYTGNALGKCPGPNLAHSPVQAALGKHYQQSRQQDLRGLVQTVEERAGDLQRQLLMAQCELKAAREDAHIHELDKSQLKAQLSGELILYSCCTCLKSCRSENLYREKGTLLHSSLTATMPARANIATPHFV